MTNEKTKLDLNIKRDLIKLDGNPFPKMVYVEELVSYDESNCFLFKDEESGEYYLSQFLEYLGEELFFFITPISVEMLVSMLSAKVDFNSCLVSGIEKHGRVYSCGSIETTSDLLNFKNFYEIKEVENVVEYFPMKDFFFFEDEFEELLGTLIEDVKLNE